MKELEKQLKNLPMLRGMNKSDIIRILLNEEYGFLPDKPKNLSAEVVSKDETFCAGKAVLENIKLTCHTVFGEFSFPIVYIRPTKMKTPMPCVIHINFRDLIPDKEQPTEEIVDSGFAVLTFCYTNVTSDDKDFTNGLAGLVYPEGKRMPNQCGKIGLWAWAAHRVLDYALTLQELDHKRISVVGHSRLGKTALLAGALDERFYCAYSNESGCGGAAISREKRGERIRRICDKYPFWFCDNFKKYQDREEDLPFDQHFVVAANAPHRVYVSSAEEDIWCDPEKEYLSCVAASSYYDVMVLKGFVHPDRMPEVGECFHEGMIGYHIRSGIHYLSREDWNKFLSYLNQNQ